MDSAPTLWANMCSFAKQTERPLQLVIGETADAACAARSLMRLLRGGRVLFDAHVVSKPEQVTEIARANRDNALDENPRDTYLMIGCGATVDLTAVLDMAHVTSVFVIDSRRPVHLANMRADRVVIWDRVAVSLSINRFFARHNRKLPQQPSRKARRRSRSAKASKAQEKHMRRKAHRTEIEDDLSDSTSEDDDDQSSASEDEEAEQAEASRESSLASEFDAEDLDLGDGRRIDWLGDSVPPRLERLYYSGTWNDTPAAMLAYDLAVSIGQLHDSIIWNASVGCADLLRRRGMTPAAYDVEYDKLADAVGQAAAARKTLQHPLTEITNESATCTWRLVCGYDYALFCLRHTSLQEALELDAVLAARLRVHLPSEGPTTISDLFAHVGVSLQTARKKWSEASNDTRSDVLRRLGEELLRLGYVDGSFALTRRSVSRAVGFGAEVSPFDACTLFEAEMSRPPPRLALANPQDVHEHYRRQFWAACDVLDASSSSKQFASALQEALTLADVITSTTAEIAAGGVVVSPLVHYTLIGQRSSQAVTELSHPVRLRWLADHVMEALATKTRRHHKHPLLLGCPVPNSADGSSSGDHARTIVLCSLPQMTGLLDAVDMIGEIAAARIDSPGGAARAEHMDPLVTTVRGQQAALEFLEEVHLRLAH
jgi:hypothetical protein